MRKRTSILVTSLILLSGAVVFSLWCTRAAAVVGVYKASGVWGTSTLSLNADHTFIQVIHFRNPYSGQPNSPKEIEGHWKNLGRNGFSQGIELETFIGLAPWDRGKKYVSFPASYGPVALSGLGIEVDTGANIVYRK